MHEAILYRELDAGLLQCGVCAHECSIAPGERGQCGVRRNVGGKLYSLVYGRPAALSIDPIEKKPLFHFLPGTQSVCVGSLGCNFRCQFCQNWELSRGSDLSVELARWGRSLSPTALVEHATAHGYPSLSFTYNEPTVFIEFALETMQLAAQRGIRSVFVSNGYMSAAALKLLAPWLAAINIDLKSFSEDFYRDYCAARLGPVLDTIALARALGVWVELTTLVIPGLTDSADELTALARFIASVSPDIPWHVTAFHPEYLMSTQVRTTPEQLCKAYEIGKQAGLRYVYCGNILDAEHSATRCPSCDGLLVARERQVARVAELLDGQCALCAAPIPGIWA